MVRMQLRDAKPDDADDERDNEPDLVADSGSEAGQVIATTIRGRNGLPKQSVSYVAEHVVGTGSFGVVFQAKCRETGEVVAIKKVLQDKRYKNRELQTMHMLDHPNIVGLRHYFFSTTERNELYLNLVLEFVPETVNRMARQYNRMNQRVPLIYVKLYTYQICRALAYIHNCVGICHRDIKPQNVLVKRDCWFKGNPYFNMISSNSTKSGATHVLSWCGATRGSRTLCHTVADDHADVGESITVDNGSNDLSRSFSMSSSDDTNFNIVFFTPGSKKAKVLIDSDGGMVTSLSKIESQFGMSTTSLDMPDMDDYQQLQQDFIACTVRTKHGCATHPRSIAERERRARNSKRLRRLQDLVPNMDKKIGGNHGWSICELGLRSLSQIMLHCQLPAVEEPELSGMRMSSCQLADDDNKEDRLAKLLGQI